MKEDTLIQVFTRPPVPGTVKTRLIDSIGAEAAAELHADLANRLLDELTVVEHSLEIWCSADPSHPFFVQRQCDCWLQEGGGLGERMRHALDQGLGRATRVVLVGTDLPELDAQYINRALAGLKDHDVVIGPVVDGGYGLIGVRVSVPELFAGIRWSDPGVLAATCLRLNQLRLNYAMLPMTWDVDTPEDLVRYRQFVEANGQGSIAPSVA